ncbi:Cof-type HAD-IIB family hydrolase [Bariatricus massiliensis]|uniref:Cof-type HAD-IIB family hydrolase n=1 Tax=Bariatricus massiliensis TaxID=1745713 RepID=A0ABS8DGH1_9FIRM|nr:Cof-type HAD-IIB family hydrolase [Bariatricus massiliensis]MCB7304403.1 Cof-type HAD-IIB family hydrolase [Bariatricus massiliensis]MCB7375054.1 Cof-type HAD-IIB family hydrolase [Bariatricus massiliensis]MCB7387513.1 Cof-type HAD-IIB family hydrolase [Bariatricus massiliensis]MCB7411675.1 Cof-type HAD-IIB family hydrolase [Bariatricus massiliensis]MCQ5253810.1 Cof-type HAD-IIB family hydrolase [Bariatricus massiliensis]
MIKLIASDLDGTLVRNYEQTISTETFDLIRQLKDRGIMFVPASGRQYANMRRLFAPLGYEVPYISENGSLCIYNDEILSTGQIPPDTIRHILDALMEYRSKFHTGHCILSVKDTYYTDSNDAKFMDYMHNTMGNIVKQIPDLYAVNEPLLKAAICDFNGTKDLLPFFTDKLKGEIRVATSASHWIDFIAPNANKGTALKALMERFGIRKEECVCFGDQQNDVEMLKLAGTSYAMDTAVPEVVKHADHVIESVEPVLKEILAAQI